LESTHIVRREEQVVNRKKCVVLGSVALVGVVALAGCASLKLSPPPSAAASAELERGFVVQHGPAEVQFVVTGAPDQVAQRLTSAFMAETLAVTSSQPGLIEAKLPADNQIGVAYQVVARGLIAPAEPGSTRVRLYGERTVMFVTKDSLDVQRIDGGMYGRSGATWLSFLRIATSLQPDSSKRVVVLPP
jgi:hypothetical protein